MSPPLSALYGTLADAYKAVQAAHLALSDDERLTCAEQREHWSKAHDALCQFRLWAGCYMLAAEKERT